MKVLVINVICSFKQCIDINYSQIDEKKNYVNLYNTYGGGRAVIFSLSSN